MNNGIKVSGNNWILVIQIIGIKAKNSIKPKIYFGIHFGGSSFNKRKARIKFGARAQIKLKLFGAVEWFVKNHKYTITNPNNPVIKNNIKSNNLVRLEFLQSL